jgi:hypothetical protein
MFSVAFFRERSMKKFGLSILPALLLGATMALPTAPASADVFFDYTGNGTYSSVDTPPVAETFSGSFTFDATTGYVTLASLMTSSLGNFNTIAAEGGSAGTEYTLLLTNPTYTWSLPLIDTNAMLLGNSVVLDAGLGLIGPNGRFGTIPAAYNIIGTFTTAVPEPSTWVMMLLGFAGFGVMAYRRKSKPAMMAA